MTPVIITFGSAAELEASLDRLRKAQDDLVNIAAVCIAFAVCVAGGVSVYVLWVG